MRLKIQLRQWPTGNDIIKITSKRDFSDEGKRSLKNMCLSEDLMTEGNILGFTEVKEF